MLEKKKIVDADEKDLELRIIGSKLNRNTNDLFYNDEARIFDGNWNL